MTLLLCAFLSELVVIGDLSPLFNVSVGYYQNLFDSVLVQDLSLGVGCTGMVDVPCLIALDTPINYLVVFQGKHLTASLEKFLVNFLPRVALCL